MPSLSLTPLSSLRISTHLIPSHSLIPNTTPHSHPLFIYHSAYPPSTSPSTIESHLPLNRLTPQWRYTMYSTSHFHSTTHEVLCVFSGRAKLLFGGEANPGKVEAEVSAGDVLVVPAGVAHRLVEDVEGGFSMVGAYPKGCSWDMCYGKGGEGDLSWKVGDVKWFEKDPLYGEDGPVLWGREKLEGRSKEKTEL
ncbi:cupin domain-containing protein [Phaeosphaeriaceae sp. SRC1lsM3a]|nr:cupin domain-containing protein [Stagonospora sp. SRC1lsM3a]